MPHRHGVRTVLLSCLVVGGCSKSFDVPDEKLEVKKSNIKADLPAIPEFQLPKPGTDGSHSVKELRVKGRPLFEKEITVTGYVTYAYDCMTDIRKPGESDADVQKEIDEDQTKCQRPKFYIGDETGTPPEKSIWVVDVPRPFTKLEIKNGGKEELAHPPPDRCSPTEKDPKKSYCPPYKVGDKVTITGKWSQSSNHSEKNSDGLLVYKKMTNETQSYTSPEPPPPPPNAPNTPNQKPPTGPPPHSDGKKTSG
jgi:hypothetical protein